MTQFSLEVLRAQHGDCLLLRHGDQLILIDGGPSGVYDDTLKPRLDELAQERGGPPFLRMVMVSHIDDDHIVGLRDMFADAVDRREQHLGPPEWKAGELWLNAFGALTGAGPTAGSAGVQGAALQAMVASVPGSESKAIGAGVKSGIALHEDAIALGVGRNASFGGNLVQRGGAAATVEVVPGLKFTVLAPGAKPLMNLRKKWEKWEQDHPAPKAKEAENLDRTVFNLSSIVVFAQAGDRTMLLTGDARSDFVLEGLEDAKLLPADGKPLTVDILKLPHHGSIRNVDAKFFARVRARNYVISANGRDGNPENETLRLLCDSRLDDDEPWTLWLTYGGVPDDGRPGFQKRISDFLAARTPSVDARLGKPGERHTIKLG